MKKEVFVTEGLHRIKGQIAEAAKKSPDTDVSGPFVETGAVPPHELLSPETREALQKRHDEFIRFRRDILFKLHEMLADCSASSESARKLAADYSQAEAQLGDLLNRLETLEEPDTDSENYQIRLSEACRSLERIRLEMIPLRSQFEKTPDSVHSPASRTNLFAELDSVSFGQIFRVGLYLLLPLMLMVLFFGLLLSAVIIMTFRIGL